MVEAGKHIYPNTITHSLESRNIKARKGPRWLWPSIITSQKLSYNSREAFLVDQGSLNNLVITKTSSSNSPSLFQTWIFSNVVLNICGNEEQISICSYYLSFQAHISACRIYVFYYTCVFALSVQYSFSVNC
jgi:hypothetical protein